MKRRELIKTISDAGCVLDRHGRNHDLYMNPKTGKKTTDSKAQRN